MRIVLNTTQGYASLNYFDDVDGISLAYACEIDVAVSIIAPTGASEQHGTGLVVSFIAPQANNGSWVCYDDFNKFSTNTSCLQAGFDYGLVKSYDTRRDTSHGPSAGVLVGQGCKGGGTCCFHERPPPTCLSWSVDCCSGVHVSLKVGFPTLLCRFLPHVASGRAVS